MISIAS